MANEDTDKLTADELQALIFAKEAEIDALSSQRAALVRSRDVLLMADSVKAIPGLTDDERDAIIKVRALRMNAKAEQV
jgi:hypothetical protein